MPTQGGPPNTLGHFLMHVGKCVHLWESPSPRCADARHGALAGVHTLYSLYIASTWSTRRNMLPAEALQPLHPLHPLHPLQLYILYSIHPSTSPGQIARLLPVSTGSMLQHARPEWNPGGAQKRRHAWTP